MGLFRCQPRPAPAAPKPTVTFVGDEIGTLVALVSSLDPATYRHPETRSVIEKCKHAAGLHERGPITLRFR